MTNILQKLSVATLGAALSFAAIEANPAQSDAAVISGSTGLSDVY